MGLGSIAIIVVAVLSSFVYLRFANIDHRYPDKSPSVWACGPMSLVVGYLAPSSVVLAKENPEFASNLSMVVLGILVAPAVAPPEYLDPKIHPSRIERWVLGIKSKLSALVANKFIAAVIAVVAFLAPWAWYWIAPVVCGFLLVAKGSAIASQESKEFGIIPPWTMKKWGVRTVIAILCFSIVWAGGLFLVLSETGYSPSSWGAFAGLGLGSLVFGFQE